jgi:hypothetical protein
MDNSRGSAVAIVMLVLAVVSMIGVALLTRSRMDMQFTSSLKTYNEMVSRADALATEQLRMLKASYTYVAATVGALALPVSTRPASGGYTSSAQTTFTAYSTSAPAGWQTSMPAAGTTNTSFHLEHYLIRGTSTKQYGYGSSSSKPESVVEIAVSVIKHN